MGRASSSKRAARAARAAGRAAHTKKTRNVAWPVAMVAVVALGATLIVLSRSPRAEASAPLLNDHWHAAYGISVCGQFLPPLNDATQDTSGIHGHGDGLIHLHPFSTRYTGDGANLGAFADQVGMTLQDDLLQTPGTGPLANDGGTCGDEPAVVQVKVWSGFGDDEGRLLEGDFADFAPPNGSLVTIAFAPVGAELPKPPSAGTVPQDVPGAAPVGGEPSADASTTTTPEAPGTTAPDTTVPETTVPDTTSTTSGS